MSVIEHTSIQYLKGVGPAKKKLLANLGVESVGDLFYLFPRRYEDRRHLVAIRDAVVGDCLSLMGCVIAQKARRSWHTKKHVLEVVIGDQTGRITCIWFNQSYLVHCFKPGRRVIVYGKVEIYRDRLQVVSPEYEILDNDAGLSANRIVPIYPLTRGITQRYLRKTIATAFQTYRDQLKDILPVGIRNKYRLLNIEHSLEALHFPESFEQQEEGARRISFEEFFLFQLSVRQRRLEIVRRPGVSHYFDSEWLSRFRKSFPFEFTGAQQKVMNEIAGDMQKDFPMLRLLQGDVGCGKTLVSLFGCLIAVQNGFQAAILVPTEILAQQHFSKIRDFAEMVDPRVPGAPEPQKNKNSMSSGFGEQIRPALLVGSMKKGEKEQALADIRSGQANLVIGTHAILSEAVEFRQLSFAVIDEQHKFGVRQRALLGDKGVNPDILVMTATPIPRTLSLTLFGDLDVSTIDELPKNRGRITTRVFSPEQDRDVYEQVKRFLTVGHQAYVVYPVIQESERADLKAAEEMYKFFRQDVFREFRVALAHGRMGRAELTDVMQRFKAHEFDLLVATTVLEVGVDVPNANVMVVEHAERFGLSQLHQLRGRIGRGSRDASCFLIGDPQTPEAIERLDAISSTTDGFSLAQKDLEIRGPGHYFGRHQHGMTELRFANPIRQVDILTTARNEAEEMIHTDPDLRDPAHHILLTTMRQRYPGYLDHIEAG